MALNFLNDGYFAGKVGIGKPVPTKPLDVIGNAQVEGTLTVETSSNNIRLLDSNDSTVNFSVGVNGRFQIRDVLAATNPFQIEKAAPSNSFRITSSGNIGIGVQNPARKLEVDFTGSVYGAKFTRSDASGSSLIEFANSAGVKSIIGYDAGVDGYKIGTASATNLVVRQSGNVGIGTTGPAKKLHVLNSTNEAQIRLGQSGSGSYDIGVYTGDKFSIGRDADTQEFTLSAGNVGIGTTSPSYKLHVKGTVNGNVNIAVENASTGTNAYASYRFKNNSISTAVMFLNGSNNSGYAGASSLNMYQGTNLPLGFVD